MANRDRYFFDKRIVKKSVMKYLGLFVIAFIVLVPINAFLLVDNLSQGMGLFISVLIALGIVLLGDYIILLINKKKNKNKNSTIKGLYSAIGIILFSTYNTHLPITGATPSIKYTFHAVSSIPIVGLTRRLPKVANKVTSIQTIYFLL